MTLPDYLHHAYENFHRKMPFFGSGLEESLERIPEADLFRPVGHRTIAQLLEHMLVWRKDLINRLTGQPREKIELGSPEDWPNGTGKTKADYLKAFAQTKFEIQAAVAAFDYATLKDQLHPDYDYTNLHVLEGTFQHDIYHLGQVNLLAALLKATGRDIG